MVIDGSSDTPPCSLIDSGLNGATCIGHEPFVAPLSNFPPMTFQPILGRMVDAKFAAGCISVVFVSNTAQCVCYDRGAAGCQYGVTAPF